MRFCKNTGKRGEKVGAKYILRYGILFVPKEVRRIVQSKAKRIFCRRDPQMEHKERSHAIGQDVL
jgi:hypothetical protein